MKLSVLSRFCFWKFLQDNKKDKQEALEAEWRDSKVFYTQYLVERTPRRPR